MSRRRGRLFIISAPSGAGKTSLCTQVFKSMTGIERSISYTTRPKRNGESSGKDYHFISETDFKKMINENRFAEWAVVHGAYYGTDSHFIESKMEQGIDIVLNIDVQGGEQLKKKYPDSVLIFIHTPSFEELKKRLIERQSDSKSSIEKRLQDADRELKASSNYKYHVINDTLERAAQELLQIIESERR